MFSRLIKDICKIAPKKPFKNFHHYSRSFFTASSYLRGPGAYN
jgi:hypothetical protein